MFDDLAVAKADEHRFRVGDRVSGRRLPHELPFVGSGHEETGSYQVIAGYDDLQSAKKRLMRRAEARAMQLLRKRRCLPVFALRKNRAVRASEDQ